jgi:hypothetical protein
MPSTQMKPSTRVRASATASAPASAPRRRSCAPAGAVSTANVESRSSASEAVSSPPVHQTVNGGEVASASAPSPAASAPARQRVRRMCRVSSSVASPHPTDRTRAVEVSGRPAP